MLIFVHGDPNLHFGDRTDFEVNDSLSEAYVRKIAEEQHFNTGDRHGLLHSKHFSIKSQNLSKF